MEMSLISSNDITYILTCLTILYFFLEDLNIACTSWLQAILQGIYGSRFNIRESCLMVRVSVHVHVAL